MNVDWNQLVATMESQAVRTQTALLMSKIIPMLGFWPFLSGPIEWGVSFVIAMGIKYGDWAAYFGLSTINNEHNGALTEAAIDRLNQLPANATAEERAAAEKGVKDAFDRLMGAT